MLKECVVNAVQKCYIIIAVTKILDIFWENMRGEISKIEE